MRKQTEGKKHRLNAKTAQAMRLAYLAGRTDGSNIGTFWGRWNTSWGPVQNIIGYGSTYAFYDYSRQAYDYGYIMGARKKAEGMSQAEINELGKQREYWDLTEEERRKVDAIQVQQNLRAEITDLRERVGQLEGAGAR